MFALRDAIDGGRLEVMRAVLLAAVFFICAVPGYILVVPAVLYVVETVEDAVVCGDIFAPDWLDLCWLAHNTAATLNPLAIPIFVGLAGVAVASSLFRPIV